MIKLHINREGRQQKQEELQFCSLWKENHIHKKIQNEKTEDFVPDEGTRLTSDEGTRLNPRKTTT